MLVRIPFGVRLVRGIIVGPGRAPRGAHLKPITAILSPVPLASRQEIQAVLKLAHASLESYALLLKSLALVRSPLRPSGYPASLLRSFVGRSAGQTPLRRSTSVKWGRGRKPRASITIRWERLEAVLPSVIRGPQLFLAPETSIANQALEILRTRNLPAVFFSQGVRVSQRRALLARIANGDAMAVVATHPGIFLPSPALEQITVLEAALASHRQWDLHPRYDARVGALLLAQSCGIPLTFQSTLPSLDLLALKRTRGVASRSQPPLASARVVPRSFNDPLLTPAFLDLLRNAASAGERVFLFHDIVGTERAFTCETCGAMLRCPTCLGMLERAGGSLKCRSCGAAAGPVPHFCPLCRSPHLSARRVGTGKLEFELRRHFPEMEIARADRETVPRFVKEERRFSAALVLGTERAFAVLPPASVDRVLVVSADRILEEPRFDADERFLLILHRLALLQRTSSPVVLQTLHPHARVVKAVGESRVAHWLEEELSDRDRLLYPPVAALLKAERLFPSEARALKSLRDLAARFARGRLPDVRTGIRVRRAPLAARARYATVGELLLRGPLSALHAALQDIPSGWSTDPIVPVTELLRSQLARD